MSPSSSTESKENYGNVQEMYIKQNDQIVPDEGDKEKVPEYLHYRAVSGRTCSKKIIACFGCLQYKIKV